MARRHQNLISAELEQGLLQATQAAAIAAAAVAGRGDEHAADKAAVEAMRKAFATLNMTGRVVIGEGERDEAPMLYIGEEIGAGGADIDIAVDPLEGTTLTAKSMANALTVAAFAARGALLNAPDVYMEKIAVGGGLPDNIAPLDAPVEKTITALARAKSVPPERITACVLDRPRHTELIARLRKAGAAVSLITDGDIAGVMHAAMPSSPVDIYIGTGGAPEGVLAAAALASLGGQMEARLVLDAPEKTRRAKKMGIKDPGKILTLADMARGEIAFAASGVTKGNLLEGVHYMPDGRLEVHSMLLRTQRSGQTGIQNWIKTRCQKDMI